MLSWWRLAFIFIPAMIRGDLGSLGLYTPFAFGYLLRGVVKELQRSKKSLLGLARALGLLGGFLGLCWYKEIEIKSLMNFFLSSFVSPMIRWYSPEYGNHIVHALLVSGLVGAWVWQGIDTLFLGFLFLQAVPEIQSKLWEKPTQNTIFTCVVLGLSLPFATIGACYWWYPAGLDYFPVPYLKVLCIVANAQPDIPDHYATLGLSRGASDKLVHQTFRKLAKELHPDKVGDDPVLLERLHLVTEAKEMLTKPDLKAEYDERVTKQELISLIPRCAGFILMMMYWVAHALLDYNDLEQARNNMREQLRKHILNDGPVNFKALGLTQEELKLYCQEPDNELPFVRHNNQAELEEFRALLVQGGCAIEPLPEPELDDEDKPIELTILPPRKQAQAAQPAAGGKVMMAPLPKVSGAQSGATMRNLKKKKTRHEAIVKKYQKKGSSCLIM